MSTRMLISLLLLSGFVLATGAQAQAADAKAESASAPAGTNAASNAASNAADDKAKTEGGKGAAQGSSSTTPDPKTGSSVDKQIPKTDERAECVSANLVLIEPDKLRQFGDSVVVRLDGGCVRAFKAAAAKAGNSKAPSLFLDGVEMKKLDATPLESEAATVDLAFSLIRDSGDDDSRRSWDTLLAKQRLGYPMKLPVAVALGADPAVVVAGEKRLVMTTVRGGELAVFGVVAVGIVALLLTFYGLLKGNALRDSWDGAYSLGKSQMAFWGLIVFLSFFGVWLLTGTMERIPPQTLALLGISGVTGLAAVMIGNTKDAPPDAAARLKVEQAALAAKGAAATKEEKQRSTQIEKDLKAIDAYIGRSHAPKHFLRDICDDGTGAGFHRIQVVIWTVLLGAVFVWSVIEVISMPEFPQTLLLLLGISNGTYLGFKFPEKV